MIALITGISKGFGKAFFNLHSRYMEIYGVSRNPNHERSFDYTSFENMPNPEVLILNAAIGDTGVDIDSLDAQAFENVLQVNLIQPIAFFSELNRRGKLKHLKSLIIVGSRFASPSYIRDQDLEQLPGYGYCLSKSGLSLFVNILRKEEKSFTVNIVHPGVLNTEMGSPDGLSVETVALKLMHHLLHHRFDLEFDGIYDLVKDEVIPF